MPEVVAVAVDAAVESLRSSNPDLTIVPAGDDLTQHAGHVLLVSAAVDLPRDLLATALALVENEPRIATVSFFSDDPGFLCFPRSRDGEPVPELDPDTTTRLLRAAALAPSPIPFASGPAVLLAAKARSAIGPFTDLVDYSLRGRRRGFLSVLEPTTFYRGRSAPTRYGEPEATLVAEYEAPGSSLSIVHTAARAAVGGLHVLIDAARLSPQEMGTQVATVALIRALARRDDVARVCVALAGELPDYAASLRDDPKVDARVATDRDFTPFGHLDVAHRPFQPDSPQDMDACRAVADRTAITVLDLIAYHAVSYQLAPEHWRTYRDWLRQSIAEVDAVVAPTADVRDQMRLERLPIDDDRLLVAELGTDHLTGDEPESPPPDAEEHGPFAVVLGADYTHKNRDLAVRAHHELCARGFDLTLVLAGTPVHGSSRPLEDKARTDGQRIVVLPDVTSDERNWLLRHAAVVLYPTSGEGFGLVPFEAARLGTPTAFVAFGPLAELAGDPPVLAADWSPSALADAAARLLDDPELARAQVAATLAAGDRITWDTTAAKLAVIYRDLLARPARARVAPAVDGTSDELARVRAEYDALRDAHARMQESQAYKVATRAGTLRDALLDKARRGLR